MLTPVQLFKCLADDTRLRCVALLHLEGRLCVCELTAALALSQPKISRHLALLRQTGLLTDSREGQWVYYRINPSLPGWAYPLLDQVLAAVRADPRSQEDRARLRVMVGRTDSEVCC
ncbi:MAG: metalloregulator ArsR/SmtB family transcription factor [Methylococcales bacterium]|nr:metalloregulator ArsR/SmtB family transcription factor [Methylococcales bacterium]